MRLVRGDARGPGPFLLRLLLTPFGWLFAAAAEARHHLYRTGLFTVHRVPCPVVSVGNLTVGGTGKTPLVEWVVRESRLLGLNPVVLTRGYRTRAGGVPDEMEALARSLPDLRFVSDADRVRGALTAIERHLADALVLDDGFQHHRIGRLMDLVVVDATRPFGGGHCLPRGTLREPVRALRRAGAIVVTRADQVAADRLDALRRRLRREAPGAALATAVHAPCRLLDVRTGAERPVSWLAGRRVLAVSGLGNPMAFERTLRDLGARPGACLRFPDHHAYPAADLERVCAAARDGEVEAAVTTLKDAVKWASLPADPVPALALEVRLRFTGGEEAVRARLQGALRGSCGGG